MDARGTRIPLRTHRLSARAFWRRYGRLEHERLEFKRSAQRVHESVVAMAMAGGGTIVLGVADDRRLVGCAPDQGTLDRIALVAHETQVDVAAHPLRVGRVVLTLIVVPEVCGRIVTTPDGRILRRQGSANQPLRGDAVARFVRARDAGAAQ
jgi:predicted HTH transcriptional regulator